MNYYDILGVKKNASQEEIKNAHKNLIKKYHPDIYPGDKSFAESKSKEINVAYDILSDPEKRAEYDMEINPNYYTSPTYDYTPPKYSNPSSYSYENYYRNKNASEFGDYYKRYTDYHRSKTPNSNYNKGRDIHNEFSNTIINSVDKMTVAKKLLIILAILASYIVIFFLTISKFNSFNNGEETGTLLNSKKPENTEANTSITNTIIDDSEEFDIYDYVTEDELREVYDYYYSDSGISFSEFKKTISDYMYYTYFYEN